MNCFLYAVMNEILNEDSFSHSDAIASQAEWLET